MEVMFKMSKKKKRKIDYYDESSWRTDGGIMDDYRNLWKIDQHKWLEVVQDYCAGWEQYRNWVIENSPEVNENNRYGVEYSAERIESRLRSAISLDILEKILEIINDIGLSISKRGRAIKDLMEAEGFDLIGSGTNRIVFRYEGYVYKIALDDLGIRDNITEFKRSMERPEDFAICYETNALVLTQEYVNLFADENALSIHRNEIRALLRSLSKEYIIQDLGVTPKNYCNYGTRPSDDSVVILDYGYVYPIVGNEDIMTCGCGGPIVINEDFAGYHCANPKCGCRYDADAMLRRMNKEPEDIEDSLILMHEAEEVNKEHDSGNDFDYRDEDFAFMHGEFKYLTKAKYGLTRDERSLEEDAAIDDITERLDYHSSMSDPVSDPRPIDEILNEIESGDSILAPGLKLVNTTVSQEDIDDIEKRKHEVDQKPVDQKPEEPTTDAVEPPSDYKPWKKVEENEDRFWWPNTPWDRYGRICHLNDDGEWVPNFQIPPGTYLPFNKDGKTKREIERTLEVEQKSVEHHQKIIDETMARDDIDPKEKIDIINEHQQWVEDSRRGVNKYRMELLEMMASIPKGKTELPYEWVVKNVLEPAKKDQITGSIMNFETREIRSASAQELGELQAANEATLEESIKAEETAGRSVYSLDNYLSLKGSEEREQCRNDMIYRLAQQEGKTFKEVEKSLVDDPIIFVPDEDDENSIEMIRKSQYEARLAEEERIEKEKQKINDEYEAKMKATNPFADFPATEYHDDEWYEERARKQEEEAKAKKKADGTMRFSNESELRKALGKFDLSPYEDETRVSPLKKSLDKWLAEANESSEPYEVLEHDPDDAEWEDLELEDDWEEPDEIKIDDKPSGIPNTPAVEVSTEELDNYMKSNFKFGEFVERENSLDGKTKTEKDKEFIDDAYPKVHGFLSQFINGMDPDDDDEDDYDD